MLRIRLSRVGKKGQPYYRVVVADAESKRDGRIVENIGHYNTLVKPSTFVVKEDRVLYWLSVGAQPSDTVLDFLKKRGTMNRLQRLRAGEALETLVAEVEGPKEAPKAAPQKAAPASEPAAVVEMEAVEQPVAEEAVAEEIAAEAESVVEMEAVEQPVAEEAVAEEIAAEAESVVEMEAVETAEATGEAVEAEEEGEGLLARARDAVADAAEAVGDAAAGAAGAVRDAVEDILGDEEE